MCRLQPTYKKEANANQTRTTSRLQTWYVIFTIVEANTTITLKPCISRANSSDDHNEHLKIAMLT